MTTTTTERPTFEQLCNLEPRLRALANDIRREKAAARGKRNFCANNRWYREYKPRLLYLVGWHTPQSIDPALRSMAAYDTAYETLYEMLPDCRRCGCLSLADFL